MDNTINIELTEEEPKRLEKTVFDKATAFRLYQFLDDRVSLDFPSPANEEKYEFRSSGLVGIIPFEDFVITINPKVSIANLFGMLEYAYHLKSFELLEGLTDVDSMNALYERLAHVFVRRVLDRVRKGLYRGYVEKTEDLSYLSGRVLVAATIRRNLCGSARLECVHEEQTADLLDNKILAWTLFRLSRSSIQRDDVRGLIRRATRVMNDVVDISPVLPTDCIGRFYHRLNEDYRPMHGLCRFFLESQGPGISAGEHAFIPFTLNMPGLFENFVAEWLHARVRSVRVFRQYDVELGGTNSVTIRIDIVLRDAETDAVLAVMDTKYKRALDPDSKDVMQVVGYAATMRTTKAILVYPSRDTRTELIHAGEIIVTPLIFDLSEDIERAGIRFAAELLEVLGKKAA